MEYSYLPFPNPEDSSSRYVNVKAYVPKEQVAPTMDRPETWRRIMLAEAMRVLRVEDMPPLLLDQLIEKMLFESRIAIGRFLDLTGRDWKRSDHG